MVLKCTYVDEAKRIEHYLNGHRIDTREWTLNSEPEIYLAIFGKLSPSFQRSLWEFINDNKMRVEVQHAV